MLQIQDVIVSFDILTKEFCCDLSKCRGACCVEGDAGAPLTSVEVELIEELLPIIRADLSTAALRVIAEQGVAYTDPEGESVTSIVDGKECVLSYRDSDGCCRCAIEKAYREGRTDFIKPISCHLYPIRVSKFGDLWALNYHRWNVCHTAVVRGQREQTAVYRYLKEPLIRRFGQEWYDELEIAARGVEGKGNNLT